jgi:predicted DNA-binding transcriptional regulator AlpA
VKRDVASRCLASLRSLSHPLSFELVGLPDRIVVQLSCATADRAATLAVLQAYFPDVKVRERQGFLRSEWLRREEGGAVLHLGLGERVFRSLETDVKFDIDPLIETVGRLTDLAAGELGLIQVVFEPASPKWGADLVDFVSHIEDTDHVLPVVRAKFSEPTYAVVLRVAALASNEDAAFEKAEHLARALAAATRSESNVLQLLDSAEYSFDIETEDILDRESHRSGMLLSLSELATLVHLPSVSVRSSKLQRHVQRTKAAPGIARNRTLVLGTNEHDGVACTVGLSVEQRLHHTYLIGASGTGKSTLLLSIAVQDMAAGNGLAVLDPHGDLVEDILARVPEERAKDVILFDPADEAYPVGFNILSAHSELERTLLSSDLVAVFRRLSTTFGDQMVSVLGNAILAFLESSEGGTLLDLRRFLLDKTFRAQFLETVQDEEVVSYWQQEFTLLKGLPHASILTRLNAFLRPKVIRYMVAQKKDRLDLRAIMDGRKILLAKLSQGAIGAENSHLLGSLLVAKIAQAAMSRQDEAISSRTPFFLYIDEFHHFVTPSIAAILSGARKYALGLTLAHQEMRQLKERSEEVASAVLANAYNRIVFRVGDQDAGVLANGLSFFEATDLLNLGVGEAIVRVERPDFDFNLRTSPLEKVDRALAASRRETILAASRAVYATPRGEVEALVRAGREESVPASGDSPVESTRRRKAKGPATTAEEGGSREPVMSTLPGRGGPQHKYLQSLVKHLAEDRGFKVSMEKEVLDGHGYVDVVLERDGLTIGCEISVTTGIEQEVSNLSKCLAAGFDHAILVSSDRRILDSARAALANVDEKRLRFLVPDEVIEFLEDFVATPTGASHSSEKKSPPPSNRRHQASATPETPPDRHLLSAAEAARYLGLATQTLAKMRVSGESPPYHKLGRSVVYDPADLEAWLAVRKRRSTSDRGSAAPSRRATRAAHENGLPREGRDD